MQLYAIGEPNASCGRTTPAGIGGGRTRLRAGLRTTINMSHCHKGGCRWRKSAALKINAKFAQTGSTPAPRCCTPLRLKRSVKGDGNSAGV